MHSWPNLHPFGFPLPVKKARQRVEDRIADAEWDQVIDMLDFALEFGWEYYLLLVETIFAQIRAKKHTVEMSWALARPRTQWESVACDDTSLFYIKKVENCHGDDLRIQTMLPNVLYIPFVSTYSVVDMLFKTKTGYYFGLKVTKAPTHPEWLRTYNSFFDKVGINTPEQARLFTLIIVTSSKCAEGYRRNMTEWKDWMINRKELEQEIANTTNTNLTSRIESIKFGVMQSTKGLFSNDLTFPVLPSSSSRPTSPPPDPSPSPSSSSSSPHNLPSSRYQYPSSSLST